MVPGAVASDRTPIGGPGSFLRPVDSPPCCSPSTPAGRWKTEATCSRSRRRTTRRAKPEPQPCAGNGNRDRPSGVIALLLSRMYSAKLWVATGVSRMGILEHGVQISMPGKYARTHPTRGKTQAGCPLPLTDGLPFLTSRKSVHAVAWSSIRNVLEHQDVRLHPSPAMPSLLPSTASATTTRSPSAVRLALDDGVDEWLVVVHNEPNRRKHGFPSTGPTGATR